jgi:drug/metabolite transporter (DMT)-like permease
MSSRRGYIALFVTLLIWGSTFLITKVVLREIGPLILTGLRFIIAFAVLAPLAARTGFRPAAIFHPDYLLLGLSGTAMFYTFQNVGLNYTSVSSTVLIQSCIPAMTAVMAVIFLKERLTPRQILGIGMVTLGVIVVGLTSRGGSESYNPPLGNLLILGSAVAWSVYTILGRRMVSSASALVMTATSTASGLIFLIPLAGWEVWAHGLPHLSLGAVLGIGYLGVAASGLTMFLWNYALHYLPASVAVPYINLIPIIGLASGLFLGEVVPPSQLLGGGLAILGVWMSSATNHQ